MTWPTTNPIAQELDAKWQQSQALFQQWWYQADLDTKMTIGQQDWVNAYNPNYRNQKNLIFNKILRIRNMVTGYQRDNRLATQVIPADNDPDRGKTADQLSTVLGWVMRQDQTYDRISDCFEGAITCGMNLMQVWMDFRGDPENGEIRTSRIPYAAMLMDPYWENFETDCGWVWTRRYITPRQLEAIFPKIKKDMPYLNKGYAAKDGKFQYLAQNWYQYHQEMYAYDEYWTKDYKKVKKVLDRRTGEVIDWKGNREQFGMFRQYNPNIELITAYEPTIRMHCLVNNQLVYEEEAPWGLNSLPFIPFTCYHTVEAQDYAYRYMGLTRNLRDSQVELNRRRNRLLDILDAQVQSGLMVKEDALVNPEDAFFQGPGKVLYFKQSSNLATDVAPIPAPPVAQGWMELIQTVEEEIMSIVGPEELFAQNLGAKEMTGILMKLKQGAGLIGLRNIFDKLDKSQMYLGNLMIDLVQKNFEPGKIAKILGEEPTEEFSDSFITKYHSTVEDTILTSSQRQLKFLDAVQLKQIIPDSIPDSYLLEQSTLPGKNELLDYAEKRAAQAAKMQQMQFIQEVTQAETLARSMEAKAQSDFATAEERKARVATDVAWAQEHKARAVQDRAAAALTNAKTMHELEDMHEDRLIKLANFVVDLETKQKQLQMQEEMKADEEAAALTGSVKQADAATKPKPKPQAQ